MNYSAMSDAQLDHAIAMARLNPMAADPRAVDAMLAERAARRAPKQPDNVERDLDAAATPVTPDPEVKPRVIVPPKKDPRTQYRDDLAEAGWSDEQAERFTEQEAGMPHPFAFGVNPESERAAVGRAAERDARHSASEEYWKDVYGQNDDPPMSTSFEMRNTGYGSLPDFGGGDTDMVDGVEVPTVDLGDGKRRYRLGDLKRAQEAAADAKYAEMVSKSAQEDLAKYGDKQMVRYTYDADGNISGTEYVAPSTLTPEQAKQQANLISRRGMEGRQQRQNAALRNRPGLRDLEAKESQRRTLRSDMARLAGGSQNLHSGNNAFFQALAMLSPADQRQALTQMMPMDPRRAAVEAQNMANAGDVIKRFMTSGAAGHMLDPGAAAAARDMQEMSLPPEQQVALSIRRGEPMGVGRSAAHVGSRWNYWMNNFGPRPEIWREQNFRSEMEGLGYRPEQIDAWIDSRRRAAPPASRPSDSGSMPAVSL